jgi:hypothetical protein
MDTVCHYLTQFQLSSLIPVYFSYISAESKIYFLDMCITNKWYDGVLECIKEIFSVLPPAKQTDIIDLFIVNDQIECVYTCLEESIFYAELIETVVLFYGSVDMYTMYFLYMKFSTKMYKNHYKIVNENVNKCAYILSCLATNKGDILYYTFVQTRCKELKEYLFKKIK